MRPRSSARCVGDFGNVESIKSLSESMSARSQDNGKLQLERCACYCFRSVTRLVSYAKIFLNFVFASTTGATLAIRASLRSYFSRVRRRTASSAFIASIDTRADDGMPRATRSRRFAFISSQTERCRRRPCCSTVSNDHLDGDSTCERARFIALRDLDCIAQRLRAARPRPHVSPSARDRTGWSHPVNQQLGPMRLRVPGSIAM
jgi:hypothetical protein